MSDKIQYLVSACLCGIPCRFNGRSAKNKRVERLVRMQKAVPICPEILGGLPIPREKVEITGGEGKDVLFHRIQSRTGSALVVSEKGNDMTPFLMRGALASLRVAKKLKIEKAWMKQKSPSCGCGQIKRRGRLVKGNGVTVALFKTKGIKVVSR